MTLPPTPAQITAQPSESPVTSVPILIVAPTPSPVVTTSQPMPVDIPLPTSTCPQPTEFRAFESTPELYDAVDEYLAAPNPESTTAAATYGFPIGLWDVSCLVDFSFVFAASRSNVAATITEDLSQWDVSSGVTMNDMFQGATACTLQ
jgi:hypothetical protein